MKKKHKRNLLLALLATAGGGVGAGLAFNAGARKVEGIKKELSSANQEGLLNFAELRSDRADDIKGSREPVTLVVPEQAAGVAGKRLGSAINSDRPWEAFGLTQEQWQLMDKVTQEKLLGVLDIDLTQEDLERIKKMFEKFELTDEKIKAGLAITQARMIEAMRDSELRLELSDFTREDLKKAMLDNYTSFMGALLGHFGKFKPSADNLDGAAYAKELSDFLDNLSEDQRRAVVAALYDDSFNGKMDRMAFGIAFAETFQEMLRQQGIQYTSAWWLQGEGQGR